MPRPQLPTFFAREAPRTSVPARKPEEVLALLLAVLGFSLLTASTAHAQITPPYPASPVIDRIEFEWGSHARYAIGSDNFPVSWAEDGRQYTSWGDGGGFGGTNSRGRVSLGFGYIEGSASEFVGTNVWGGFEPETPATFDGKSFGVLALDDVLYMWVGPGSGEDSYRWSRLYSSIDGGLTWRDPGWEFVQAEGMVFPTFLQYGRNYRGALDNFVYIYAINLKRADTLTIQSPGEIVLMRVPRGELLTRSEYRFFAGLESDGSPIWTSQVADRQPVFEDPNGVGWGCSASYNLGIGRVLFITEHAQSFRGMIGLHDAPRPWGPWTTVQYGERFGGGVVPESTYFWNFSNKWTSPDGRDSVLIFTGTSGNDAMNTMRTRLVTRQPPKPRFDLRRRQAAPPHLRLFGLFPPELFQRLPDLQPARPEPFDWRLR